MFQNIAVKIHIEGHDFTNIFLCNIRRCVNHTFYLLDVYITHKIFGHIKFFKQN